MKKAPKGRSCEWFALCREPAAVMIPHPVLKLVPACAKCAAWYERMSAPRAKEA